LKKLWLGAIVALVLLIQLVPYGRSHVNPAVTREPSWDQPATRDLARRACFDCHSNETQWPWYASVAPFSWYLQRHVNEARREMNFSEWDQPQREAHEAAEKVEQGEMPLWSYLLLHPEAKLNPAEREALIGGLKATLGSQPGPAAENRGSRRAE